MAFPFFTRKQTTNIADNIFHDSRLKNLDQTIDQLISNAPEVNFTNELSGDTSASSLINDFLKTDDIFHKKTEEEKKQYNTGIMNEVSTLLNSLRVDPERAEVLARI